MLRRNKIRMPVLMLGLVLMVGSVQAQVSYFCGMMDKVVHDSCCCHGMDSGDAMLTDAESCCDRAVILGVDSGADPAQPTAKPLKFESNADPPPSLISTTEVSFQPLQVLKTSGPATTVSRQHAGSATYLITRRLRI